MKSGETLYKINANFFGFRIVKKKKKKVSQAS